MRKFKHQVNRECAQCLEVRPLLMPVRIATPYGECTIPLCFVCRTGWVDDRTASLARAPRSDA